MDEIEMIRRFRTRSGPQTGDIEQQKARERLMREIAGEHSAASLRWRSLLGRPGIKRGLAVVVAIAAVPAGYAVADGSLFNVEPGTAITNEQCKALGDAPASAEAPPVLDNPGARVFTCDDLVPPEKPVPQGRELRPLP